MVDQEDGKGPVTYNMGLGTQLPRRNIVAAGNAIAIVKITLAVIFLHLTLWLETS